MKILSLTDNLCALPVCKAQHGLCLNANERVEESFRNLRHTPEKGLQFDLTKK